MKKYVIIISILFSLFIYDIASSNKNKKDLSGKTSFRIATYNIRYNAKADVESGNGWEVRKKPIAELIKRNNFDIVATQEGDSTQIKELKALLPDFDCAGHYYGGNTSDKHSCTTFYKMSLFKVVDEGVFWFSETPDVPSIGWDATDRRICYWTKFRVIKTGKEFYTFNVHFFWKLKKAKEKSGPLLAKKIAEIAKDKPAIALGDFNSTDETSQIKAIKNLLTDTYDAVKPEGNVNTNLSGGNFIGPAKNRIDYIFASSHFAISDYKVIQDKYGDNRYPSDHLPVVSLLKL